MVLSTLPGSDPKQGSRPFPYHLKKAYYDACKVLLTSFHVPLTIEHHCLGERCRWDGKVPTY